MLAMPKVPTRDTNSDVRMTSPGAFVWQRMKTTRMNRNDGDDQSDFDIVNGSANRNVAT